MRFALLALLGCQTGCSSILAGSGRNLEELDSKEAVHRTFGTPVVEATDGGDRVEEYETRKKIGDQFRASSDSMAFGMSLGLSEVISVPIESIRVASDLIVGQRVAFRYDEVGKVVGYRVQRFSPFDSGPAEWQERSPKHELFPSRLRRDPPPPSPFQQMLNATPRAKQPEPLTSPEKD